MSEVKLGIVTSGSAGWRTVRMRWEADLADYAPALHHVEDHARAATAVTERCGGRSIGHALAGRAAARAALRAGADLILLSTLQNAPLVPLPRGANYIVYGDCTTAQLTELYGGRKLRFPGTAVNARLRRLVDHGCYFLCMSAWYRDALRRELGVGEDRVVLLPFYVDAERWKPQEQKPPKARKQVLFIGGDLERKGADVVYQLARLDAFRNVDFHVVSPHAPPGPDNLYPHRALEPESADLIRLAAGCDVFILPTRADTSSLAAMEAAACGVPTIVARCGGIPEVVIDGSTGSVLSESGPDAFAKELSAYLSDPELLARRGSSARQHVLRNYSKARHIETLRALIARAAAEVRGDRAIGPEGPAGSAGTADVPRTSPRRNVARARAPAAVTPGRHGRSALMP
jgi:glycosyltransferase involved in cell wall biosynthesis